MLQYLPLAARAVRRDDENRHLALLPVWGTIRIAHISLSAVAMLALSIYIIGTTRGPSTP